MSNEATSGMFDNALINNIMTCIAGTVDRNGAIWIGGDHETSWGLTKQDISTPKVFKNGEFLFGGCGRGLGNQIMQHIFSPPERLEGQTDFQYLLRTFRPALMRAFRDSGMLENDKGDESFDYGFLMGYRGKLYVSGADGAIVHSEKPYHAIGSGGTVAIGAMAILHRHKPKMKPEKMIIESIKAAAATAQGVNDRVTVLSLPPYKIP